MNFFSPSHTHEQPRTEVTFGLIDDGVMTKSTILASDKWMATVNNPQQRSVVVTPIDHNIIVTDNNGNEISQCDAMINSENYFLSFVELKVRDKQWIEKAISQLESTVEIFHRHHDYHDFRHRRAYACNPRRPHFSSSHKELAQRFYSRHHFRLHIEATITIP